jgi:hypothetical protein
MTQAEKMQALADLMLMESRERLARLYTQGQADRLRVEIIPGRIYTKIDLGTPFNGGDHPGEGRLMVENATGIVYGIKAYGKVHKEHAYGTLDTIHDWYWGDYYPELKIAV